MPERVIKGERVEDGEPSANRVKAYQGRYNNLLGALANVGTEVGRARSIEHDPQIAPHRFIREASHVFIFPPQPVELNDREGAMTGEVPDTAPYTVFREDGVAEYDPSQVKGSVVVAYDDSDGVPALRLKDRLEDEVLEAASDLPAEARAAIEAAFEPVSAPIAPSYSAAAD